MCPTQKNVKCPEENAAKNNISDEMTINWVDLNCVKTFKGQMEDISNKR